MFDTHTAATISAGLVGLLVGLLVAEIAYKKAARHANHVVPAIIINNSHKVVKQKQWYIAILLLFIAAQALLKVEVPGECYTLVVCALVGGDLQKIASKYIRLR